ncbi:Oidioi.mRNA.OKI2018_I69.chr2.g6972.t1.cds [Oikopleura dioica]|uniref:Oidioi.mRNA.OKI2018_I69.chr2.g6972.t1.cds n=1 Tax=Oikopleura dioica TaxID=34765 RepID=A0ABN7TDW3_OIKDI|nr:Oidioi.mRNA.OKI2018_I69.chr2.g6972.t1.cds [Oikopleura dioica]
MLTLGLSLLELLLVNSTLIFDGNIICHRGQFNYARDHQPSIIFMDEIDAIGSRRLSEEISADCGIQSTLMELLNQMGDFDTLGKVKMIMATNRPDTLDPALLRPALPNEQVRLDIFRLDILKIHSHPLASHGGIDFKAVVKLSDTFNGADLRNVCTEADSFVMVKLLTDLKVGEIRKELASVQESTRGKKAELLQRLSDFLTVNGFDPDTYDFAAHSPMPVSDGEGELHIVESSATDAEDHEVQEIHDGTLRVAVFESKEEADSQCDNLQNGVKFVHKPHRSFLRLLRSKGVPKREKDWKFWETSAIGVVLQPIFGLDGFSDYDFAVVEEIRKTRDGLQLRHCIERLDLFYSLNITPDENGAVLGDEYIHTIDKLLCAEKKRFCLPQRHELTSFIYTPKSKWKRKEKKEVKLYVSPDNYPILEWKDFQSIAECFITKKHRYYKLYMKERSKMTNGVFRKHIRQSASDFHARYGDITARSHLVQIDNIDDFENATRIAQEGAIAEGDGDISLAIEKYAEAIALDPTNKVYFGYRSDALLQQEQFPEALSDAVKAIELEPTWPKGYALKGQILMATKKFEEAKVEFGMMKKFDESPDEAIEWLSICQQEEEKECAHRERTEESVNQATLKRKQKEQEIASAEDEQPALEVKRNEYREKTGVVLEKVSKKPVRRRKRLLSSDEEDAAASSSDEKKKKQRDSDEEPPVLSPFNPKHNNTEVTEDDSSSDEDFNAKADVQQQAMLSSISGKEAGPPKPQKDTLVSSSDEASTDIAAPEPVVAALDDQKIAEMRAKIWESNEKLKLLGARIQKFDNKSVNRMRAFIHDLEDEFKTVRVASLNSLCTLAAKESTGDFAKQSMDYMVDMLNDELEIVRLNAINNCVKLASRVPVLLEDQNVNNFYPSITVLLPSSVQKCLNRTVEELIRSLQKFPEDQSSIYEAVCCLLNADVPLHAQQLLAYKIQSPLEKEAVRGLDLLEICVRSSGKLFHNEIGKYRFLNELIRVVSPKYLGPSLDQIKIADAYSMLKKQGIVKKDPKFDDRRFLPTPQPKERCALIRDDAEEKRLAELLASKNPEDIALANEMIKTMYEQDSKKTEREARKMLLMTEAKENTCSWMI